jgi:hypothetical protein
MWKLLNEDLYNLYLSPHFIRLSSVQEELTASLNNEHDVSKAYGEVAVHVFVRGLQDFTTLPSVFILYLAR